MQGKVAVLKTRPETVLDDYREVMRLAGYRETLSPGLDTIVKLNLSWTKYFPACSSQPWQLEGVLRTLIEDGFEAARLFPVENKTVVTNPVRGARDNHWMPVLEKYGRPFIPLPEVEWVKYPFKSEFLMVDRIFPNGIEIPKMFIGRQVVHLPTVKCVHPDTEIILRDGSLVSIKDLVSAQFNRSHIDIAQDSDLVAQGNVPVLSVHGDGQVCQAIARQFWKTPLKNSEKVWKIITRTGRSVTVSSEHPFLTPEGWRRAQDLETGDRIAIPRRISAPGKPQNLPPIPGLNHTTLDVERLSFRDGRRYSADAQKNVVKRYLNGETTTEIARSLNTHWESIRSILRRYEVDIRWTKRWVKVPAKTSPEFWRWVGYFTAEGYLFDANGTKRFSWSNIDEEIRQDYLQLSSDLFGVNPTCRKDEIYFDSNHLGAFFAQLGYHIPSSAENKDVLPLMFRCSDEEIANFLQGYLDGDGSVGKDGLHASTKSEKLAEHLLCLFARLGVVAFKRPHWSMATNGRMSEKRRYWSIDVYGDDLLDLSKWIHLKHSQKRRNLEALIRRRLKGKRPSNWDTIPVDPTLFRQLREGLGFTQASSGKPGSVNNVENGHQLPTRHTLEHFIDVFEKQDKFGVFKKEIAYLKFLASKDVAWDWVTSVEVKDPDTRFLYDLSVTRTNSFVGNGVFLHNTHGHTTTTGAVKNSFGGLLKEVRHYAHKNIHEVMVDLMLMQREIHPGVFAVMDGTVCGDGAGPRTMDPKIQNYLLASADSVAIDAVAARMMGFDPMSIPYIRMCHERGLGVGDPGQIEVVGADIAGVNFHFRTKRSLVIFGDQLIRKGFLRPFERLLLHSPLVVWAPFASNLYHDYLWYPVVGRPIIRKFMKTEWGQLFQRYGRMAGGAKRSRTEAVPAD